jgi:hypothetical protein
MHATKAAEWAEAAAGLPDPLARLRFYIMSALSYLGAGEQETAPAKFVTAEHWRLHQLFPEEMTLATQPTVELFATELRAAQEQGLIHPTDVNQSAELMVMLVRAVYHHYAFKATTESTATIADHVWELCLQGIGGHIEHQQDHPGQAGDTEAAVSPG